MQKAQLFDHLIAGVCYYPEQWPETMWRDDLRRMKEAGISRVRVGEFGWSKVEPVEGEFTFDFYLRFLDMAEEAGIGVIFGTPSATPPAWLTYKYPEALNCRIDGVPYRHGMRRHYNYNSPKYRELVARVVTELAENIGRHPAIIGWQIDNELNCETADFYSDSDNTAFREFLREKYGSLDKLNDAWGTVFWNQTYTDWQEVDIPRPTVQGSVNPHRALDYIRFISESACSFAKMQSDILRKHIPEGVFITTNSLFGHMDCHRLADEALDLLSYDSYPNFAFMPGAEGELRDRGSSAALSETRSISPNFIVMEQQSGPMGWNTGMLSPTPKPGQMTLWATQSVAHGADMVSFFRWRTAVFGTEMYWHGVLGYDNRDNRRLSELTAFTKRLKSLKGVAGTKYRAGFAVLRDYDNIWDAEVDRWHGFIARESENAVFAAAQYSHAPMDYLYLRETTELAELARYPALILPHAHIITERQAALLTSYVEQGGTLLIAARCGMKDENGHCVQAPEPGLLAKLTGTAVDDFTLCTDGGVPMALDGETVGTGVFNEALSAMDGTEVLARYDGGWYGSAAALTRRQVGKGAVLHFGGTFTVENARRFLELLSLDEPWREVISPPKEVELAVREGGGKRFFFLLNYTAEKQTVTLHSPLTDAETGEPVAGEVTLGAYGTRILTE